MIDWQAMKLNFGVGLLISLLFFFSHGHQGASAFRVKWPSSHHRETEREQSLATAMYGEVAPSCKSLECPAYESIHTDKDYEIRRYNHTVWMSTVPPINSISFVDATRTGFLSLFDYIQGKNMEQAKVPMTSPVLTDIFPSRGPFCESSFVVSFYVPEKFQKKPPEAEKSLALQARRWDVVYAAVRRFGGFVTDSNIGEEAAKLQASLIGTPWADAISKSQQRIAKGKGKGKDPSLFSVAQYNSPFEFKNRVNEIWMLFQIENLSHPSYSIFHL